MRNYLYYMIINTYTISLRFKKCSTYVRVCACAYVHVCTHTYARRACVTYYTKITELYCITYLMHEYMEENINNFVLC